MATRTRTPPPADPGGDDENWQMAFAGALIDEPPPETSADRIAVMLQSVAGDDKAKVKLFRVIAPGKQEWCDDYEPAQFESGGFDLIRAEWGPGVYHVMLYGRGPSNRVTIRAHEFVTIAKRAGDVESPSSAPSDLVRLIEANNKQSQEQMRALVESINANRPPAVDPMAQMMQMMTIAKAMREAFAPPAAPAASPISEILAGIKQIKGVAEEITPERDKSDDPMAMLPQILELVKAGMSARQGDAQTVQPLALPPSIASADSTADTTPGAVVDHQQPQPVEGENVTPFETIVLRGILRSVLSLAKANAPYEEVATILDKLPNEMLDMLTLPAWFETLAEVAPEVAPHREYLTRIRDQYIADVAAEDDAEPSAQVNAHNTGQQG